MATGQAYHAAHSVAETIVLLGGHIGHPFEHRGIAGGWPLQLEVGADDQCAVAWQAEVLGDIGSDGSGGEEQALAPQGDDCADPPARSVISTA
jgi:hypothetical protein